MSQLTFHWFLPTYGDSRYLIAGGHGASMSGSRAGDLKYLKQLTAAAEINHFESMLIPTGLWCEDAWIAAASLIDATESLKFLIALRPGLISPLLAAKMTVTLQRYSVGRVLLNIVTGGEDAEQQAYGDFLDKNDRYTRCAEFLDVFISLWKSHAPVSFQGKYLFLEKAILDKGDTFIPEIYFGGSSPAAGEVAAQYVDTYLTWGETPPAVIEKKQWIDDLAHKKGRSLQHGIRLHVISRDTSAEAWAVAEKLLGALDAKTVVKAQETMAQSVSEGQRRMSELHGRGNAFTGSNGVRDFEIYPNLWSGVGLVRGGAGTALVGSHQEVADLIEKYAAVGMQHFVLSGYPHLEEAYYFGEGVRPILAQKNLIAEDVAQHRETAIPFIGTATHTEPVSTESILVPSSS